MYMGPALPMYFDSENILYINARYLPNKQKFDQYSLL